MTATSGPAREDNRQADFWLGADSPLAKELEGFTPRPGQIQMAHEVERALRRGVPLVVEAGTGTGKTLAYLTPAVASGLKVVVSTGTRTLQDQISQKELPLLKRLMSPSLRFAVLKGRANYLCLRRYDQLAAQPDLALSGAGGALGILADWLRSGASGDLDQVRGQGLSPSVVSEVTADAEQCLGGRCPRRDECFLMEARRKAAEADLVVVNHHLFLADLVLRSSGHGEALPRYQAAVFDEAHLLPEVATQVFGVGVSSGRLNKLIKDLAREPEAASAAAAAAACHQAGGRFFAELRRLAGASSSLGLGPAHLERMSPHAARLSESLEELAAALGSGEAAEALAQRATLMVQDLATAAQPVAGQTVAWVQQRGQAVGLHLSPVEIGLHMDTALYQEHSRLVFTSATLAATGDLEPFRRRMGLDSDAVKLVVPSPFDPASQALLYVPPKMPAPNHPSFPSAVAREVEALLALSGGRAFVLFTSHRNLEKVSAELAPRLPFPCLVQGQAPRLELLRRFVAESPCVLFATASFWQGVDVPGPALSAVIVDKLPFAPPDDPLLAARMKRLEEEEGKSGFAHLMLPEAVLSLKQGLGRLLRTADDRGLLAVLDTRMVDKGYGRVFRRALEPTPLTRDRKKVAEFFDSSQ